MSVWPSRTGCAVIAALAAFWAVCGAAQGSADYPNRPIRMVVSGPAGGPTVIPTVLLVGPRVPAKSVAELIALIRRDPQPWTFGSGGNGTSQHIAGAVFARRAGLAITHVPYKGGPPSIVDLICPATAWHRGSASLRPRELPRPSSTGSTP